MVGVVAIAAALAISASYPVAALESTSEAMSGMQMGVQRSSASAVGPPRTCVSHQTGLRIAGLDLNNTPYMVMSGHLGMDMNGADATAAAGLNTTATNWHYTGPAAAQRAGPALLADGNNGPGDIHMAQSGCAPRLTASEQIGSTQYVQATSAAVAAWPTPSRRWRPATCRPRRPTIRSSTTSTRPSWRPTPRRNGR